MISMFSSTLHRSVLQVTIQAEYQQKGEDDDYIPLEAKPPRRDYGKKALVHPIEMMMMIERMSSF